MKDKVLFIASTHKHISGFHIPYIKMLQDWGFIVHAAGNDGDISVAADRQYTLPIERNPFSLSNLKAIKLLKRLIKQEEYKLIHCHTAMGGVVARLAAKNFRRHGLKVLYTAHGFHFYKGSPAHYWWLYYPVEKYLSRYTDGLILINTEDYQLVNKRNFKQNESYLIPGMGVKSERFYPVTEVEKNQYRKEHNLSPNDFILIYAAEYIERKNHDFILNCVKVLKDIVPNLKILLAGRGRLFEKIKDRIGDEQLNEYVIQLGFRKDIDKFFKMADVGISASRQEGLGLNLVEEMMCGLPVVATEDRGHREVVDHGRNGYLYTQEDRNEFNKSIKMLYNDKTLYESMSKAAIEKAKKFEFKNCMNVLGKIYRKYL